MDRLRCSSRSRRVDDGGDDRDKKVILTDILDRTDISMNNHVISKALLVILLSVVSIGARSQTSRNSAAPPDQVESVSQRQTAGSDLRADRALRKSIYKALAKHAEIDAGDISIVAKSGVVTLDGTVRDAGQISTVERIVRSDPRVFAVTNKLRAQLPFEE